MTVNQVAYHNMMEAKRSNAAREFETNRSNLAKELETNRANLEKERLDDARIKAEIIKTALGNLIPNLKLDASALFAGLI